MKKLLLVLGVLSFSMSLSAQNFTPYQKGEAMIGLRNPHFSAIQTFHLGEVREYGTEIDFSGFLTNNWMVGVGASTAQSRFTRIQTNEDVSLTRFMGFQAFSRYYSPSTKIGPTHLNFYGELRADTYRYFAVQAPENLALLSNRYYGGVGLAWRPFKFLSFDLTLQRGYERLIDPISGLETSSEWLWNSSFGINFHWRKRANK